MILLSINFATKDSTSFPGADEICDGLDNDCDGQLGPDEADLDGDGFLACDTDCDDSAADVNPNVKEVCDNGIDDDCDGVVDGDCDVQGCGCSIDPVSGAPLWSLFGSMLALGVLRRRRR